MSATTTFSSDQFTTTPYRGGTAADKALAATQLLRFLRAGCPKNLFTSRCYEALYLHSFGHIAHFTKHGFYETWFSTPERRAEWISYACRGGAYGFHDASRSDLWGDVERAMVAAIESEGLDRRFAAEAEADRLELGLAKRDELIEEFPLGEFPPRGGAQDNGSPAGGIEPGSALDRLENISLRDQALAFEADRAWAEAGEAWEELARDANAKAAEAWAGVDWERSAQAHERAGDLGEAAEARAMLAVMAEEAAADRVRLAGAGAMLDFSELDAEGGSDEGGTNSGDGTGPVSGSYAPGRWVICQHVHGDHICGEILNTDTAMRTGLGKGCADGKCAWAKGHRRNRPGGARQATVRRHAHV